MPAPAEKREHKRFVPEGSAFAVFRPDFRRLGPIMDISRGGLGCSYLHPVDEEIPDAQTPQIIDILLSGESLYITEIPCSPVYDKREGNGRKTFMPDLVNRQCGLKFDQLTNEQEKQIHYFLQNHTRDFRLKREA